MLPRTSTRAPMALILIGLIAGLFLARQYPAPLILLLPTAVSCCLIALLLGFRKTVKPVWTFVFIAGSTLCFWAYGSMRLAPSPSTPELDLPQREARLAFEVETVIHLNENRRSAGVTARLLQAPKIGCLRQDDLIYTQLKISEQFLRTKRLPVLVQNGLQVRAKGILKPIPHSSGPDLNDDFSSYLKAIGIHYHFGRVNELEIIETPSSFAQFCAVTNQSLQTILELGAPENSELPNIYVTMLLGNDTKLTREQRERYWATGTMHFFAISGLHIGVIAAVIAQCLNLLRAPRNLGPFIGLPLLYLYVEIIGASPSAMRAFLMTAFFWASFALRRQHTPFAALVNSAIAVLIIDPTQLWGLGFQLSYTVVASILMFGLPLSAFLKQALQLYRWLPEDDWTKRQRIVSGMVNKLVPLFAISLSAWLASMPLCAASFNFVAPGAIILNIILVCLVSVAIISGILSIGCSYLTILSVSEFINHAAWIVLSIMDWIVRIGTTLPIISFSGNNAYLTGLCYCALTAYFVSLFWLHSYAKTLHSRVLWLPVAIILIGMGLIWLGAKLPNLT